jgi:CBS domain-containing protein
MPELTSIQRVRIYLSERDIVDGQPLYIALLDRLRQEGATGATALRGVAGFGPGQRRRSAGTAGLSQSLPIVIEWVDRTERVARVLPLLDELLPDALITVEALQVYRAVVRAAGPFGERSVGDALLHDVATAEPQALARDAAERLLASGQALLPVVDAQGRVVGVLAASDLQRRGGLALHPRMFHGLAPAERDALLEALGSRPLAEIMTTEPRTIYIEASIPQAIGMMVEWGLNALPAIDRDGRLAGLFGVDQALRAAIEARAPSDAAVRNADPPVPVRLVMQTAVPVVAADAPVAEALAQLLATPSRFLVVIADRRPIGVLHETLVAGRLDDPLRAAWLAALRTPNAMLSPAFEFTTELRASDIATPVPTIDLAASEQDAIQLMLDGGHERLVVTDEGGELTGLVARPGILRSLAQESAG